MLSLTILNYFLLAIKVSFQCGTSEMKVSNLKNKKTQSFILKKQIMQKKFSLLI